MRRVSSAWTHVPRTLSSHWAYTSWRAAASTRRKLCLICCDWPRVCPRRGYTMSVTAKTSVSSRNNFQSWSIQSSPPSPCRCAHSGSGEVQLLSEHTAFRHSGQMSRFQGGDHPESGGNAGHTGEHCEAQQGQQLAALPSGAMQCHSAAALWPGTLHGSLCQQ